jgi:hypothetical protein
MSKQPEASRYSNCLNAPPQWEDSVAELTPLPQSFVVRRWVDPVVERVGFPVNSFYTETVLLPILGPSTTLCLRRLGMWAAGSPNGIGVDTGRLARDLGLSDSLARNAAMSRTLTRLCQFGMARWVDGELVTRTKVAPLAERQLQRLSPQMVEVHRRLVRRHVMEQQARSFSSSVSPAPAVESSMGLGLSL